MAKTERSTTEWFGIGIGAAAIATLGYVVYKRNRSRHNRGTSAFTQAGSGKQRPEEHVDAVKTVSYTRSADFPPRECEDKCAWYKRRLGQISMRPPDPSTTAREKELLRMSMVDYVNARRKGNVSCEEYARAVVKRAKYYRYMNQWIFTSYPLLDRVVERAIELDERAKAEGIDSIAPLFGLPVPMKGTSAVKEFPSGGGCGLLCAYTPVKNSAMTQLIRKANGIIFGCTNVPPFAYNIITHNAHSGLTLNPYNHAWTVGGSSGGAGSAVASHMCPAAVSEDTGGSTRIPAWSCGLFGFDPARNHYPNEGNSAISYTKDQIGVVARSLEDVILYDQCVMGVRHGANTLHSQAAARAEGGVGKILRVGMPEVPFVQAPHAPEWDLEGGRRLDATCSRKLQAVKAALKAGGLEVVEEEWPCEPW